MLDRGGDPAASLARAVDLLARAVVAHRRGCGADDGGLDATGREALGVLSDGCAAGAAVDAHWLGTAYERAIDDRTNLGGERRRSRGVFYTPAPLVWHVLDHVLDPLLAAPESGERSHAPPRVLDPACGCGAFLVEAAARIRERRPELGARAIAGALCGVDLDPLAASLCRLALWLDLFGPGDPLEWVESMVRVGDSLLSDPHEGEFDAVIGNPPFLSQLAKATARGAEAAARLRERFGASVRPYTDPAALFLQLGIERVRPGGRVGLVLPVSVLSSRDGAGVRSRVADLGAMRSLWLDTEGVFDAGVRTITAAFERGGSPREIERSVGSAFAQATGADGRAIRAGSWGPLAADLAGIPSAALVGGGGELGDLAEITAGFRDEYYAVIAGVFEAAELRAAAELAVVTAGMIDPAALRWGAGPARIGGRVWARPCVRAEVAGGPLAEIIARQRRPKLLIATQSKTIEVAPDAEGNAVALTPVIMAFPRRARDFWRIGAVLASPVVAAWAAAQAFGTARSLGAIKPSAALLRAAPLPTDEAAWQEAAGRFERLCAGGHGMGAPDWRAFGAAACAAHSVAGEDAAALMAWWLPRVWRGGPV